MTEGDVDAALVLVSSQAKAKSMEVAELTPEREQKGREVIPPKDIGARRKLAALMKKIGRDHAEEWDEELERRLWEERLSNASDLCPWDVF